MSRFRPIGPGLPQPPMTPEEERSVLGELGRRSIGAVGGVGNVLSVPHSMVYRGLMGENPLMPLLSPWSGEHHVMGRDFLRHHGLVGKRDNWGNFAAGLATDLINPASWIMPSRMALTPLGLAAKKSGLLRDITRGVPTVAQAAKQASKAGKPLTMFGKISQRPPGVLSKWFGEMPSIGAAKARLTRSPLDILKSLPADEQAGADAALRAAAKLSGLSDDAITTGLQQPVGKAFGIGFPLAKSPLLTAGGSGPVAQAWAGAKDALWGGFRHSPPVRGLAAAFSPGARGTYSSHVQREAPRLMRIEDQMASKGRMFTSDAARKVRQYGLVDQPSDEVVRALWEITDTPGHKERVFQAIQQRRPDLTAEALEDLHSTFNAARSEFTGMRRASPALTPELADQHAAYAPRFMADRVREVGSGVEFGKRTPSDIARQDALRNLAGTADDMYSQTNAINRLTRTTADLKGDDLLEAIRQDPIIRDNPNYYTQAQMEQLAEIGDTLSQDVIDELPHLQPKDRAEAIRDMLSAMSPEKRRQGLFPNAPVADLAQYTQKETTKLARAKWVRDTLSDHNAWASEKEGGVTLKQAADKLHLNIGKLSRDLSEALGMKPKALERLRVKQPIAEDLLMAVEQFDVPRSSKGLRKWWDNISNLTKAGQTSPWAAFHARNRIGSFKALTLEGMTGFDSWQANRALINGKPHKYWRTHPLIRAEAARQGIDVAKASDQELTRIAGELTYRSDAVPQLVGEHTARLGMEQAAAPKTTMDVLGQQPGVLPRSYGRALKRLVGEGDTTWNPLKGQIRGFRDAERSTLAPFAAGDAMGEVVEFMNRAPAFWELTARGVDPQVATDMVRLSQVDYGARAYTPLVREILRYIPYGKFQIGMVRKVSKELMERPFGPTATTIRATSQLQGDPSNLVPGWVSQQMAIPLGKTPEGDDHYATGFGLMHEPALAYAQPDLKRLGLHILSQLGPIPKLAGETATGQAFFQQGPLGGRALEDLDPPVGRTLRSLQQRWRTGTPVGRAEAGWERPVTWAGPATQRLEQLLANSPISRVLTTVRSAVDPRRTVFERALPLLSGYRTTIVSDRAKDAHARDLLVDAARKHPGGRLFVSPYYGEEAKANMSPEELAEAERMEALRNLLMRRTKERKP